MCFPNRSDANRSIQLQKQARSLKFRIKVEEELYYTSSESKGADQLRSYCEADLRLCFRLCRLLVFPWGGSNNFVMIPATYATLMLGSNRSEFDVKMETFTSLYTLIPTNCGRKK